MLVKVLGPLKAMTHQGESLELGGPQQRAVLAMLLAANGDVVPIDQMIHNLWSGAIPRRASASMHAYISNLRSILEPGRTPRTPAQLLITAAPGYTLRLPGSQVDATVFDNALVLAREIAHRDPETAHGHLAEALAIWRGPAYAEFTDQLWVKTEAARLTENRFAAQELLLDLQLRTSRLGEAVTLAEMLTHQAPEREEGWRLLATALWRTGRQADALGALRRARAFLAEEHGLTPGRPLVDLEAAILRQDTTALGSGLATGTIPEHVQDKLFIGREQQLAMLASTAASARSGQRQIVLISGEAGAGKTTVLDTFSRHLSAQGWTVARGQCLDDEGAPPGWPWGQIITQIAPRAPIAALSPVLSSFLNEATPAPAAQAGDTAARRFQLHHTVIAMLTEAATHRPVAVLLDDLQAADEETLRLLEATTEPLGVPLLFVVSFRSVDLSLRPGAADRFVDLMAVLARRNPSRTSLEGLSPAEVARVVTAITPADPGVLAVLAERTGGNPFFVRESARLLATEGALAAQTQVPLGIRDVLRHHLRQLPTPVREILDLASVVGATFDATVLSGAADVDGPAVPDAIHIAVTARLLRETAPGQFQFVHPLVRETLYTDVPRGRRATLHGRVAASLGELHPDQYSALAHHHIRAGATVAADVATAHAVKAAEWAEQRFAFDTAIDLLDQAAQLPAPLETRIDLLSRLLNNQARAGATTAAADTRAKALALAESSGDDALLLKVLTAWRVPTPWLNHVYGHIDQPLINLLTRHLKKENVGPDDRCRLLAALVKELDGDDSPLAGAAAQEALTLGRASHDPELHALGVVSRLHTLRYDREPALRRALADELHQVAVEHGLSTYTWFAEQVRGHAAATLNDASGLRDSVTRQEELARRYRLPEALAVSLGSRGALAHIAGDFDSARQRYSESVELMRRQGSVHADAFEYFTTATLLIGQGRLAEHLLPARDAREQLGPLADDLLALTLLEAGEDSQARAVSWGTYPYRPDYFESALLTFRAMVVLRLERRDLTADLIKAFLPVSDQLAGMSSTAIVVQPVALTLGRLYRLAGDESRAEEYLSLAERTARCWGAQHWEAQATVAMSTTRGSK